jgi:hypothetical protein
MLLLAKSDARTIGVMEALIASPHDNFDAIGMEGCDRRVRVDDPPAIFGFLARAMIDVRAS